MCKTKDDRASEDNEIRIATKQIKNPNPIPAGTRFGFLLFGAGDRGRTCVPCGVRS